MEYAPLLTKGQAEVRGRGRDSDHPQSADAVQRTGISLLTSTIMKRNFSSNRRLGLPGRETERSSVPCSSSLLPVEVLLRVPAQIRFRSDGAGELGPRVRHQEAVICSLLNRRLRSSRSRTEVHLQATPEPFH